MRSALASALLLLACGCPAPVPPIDEPELGPIEDLVDDVSETVWPGVVKDDGVRELRRINGFQGGKPTAYWFANFASKSSRDEFVFCRQGDAACPFDERGVLDHERIVGNPVFSTIPGAADYSPFWLVWRVIVPDDYQPDELKSVAGIEAASRAGRVQVERVIFDHGGDIGPAPTLMHCLLTLTGTELEKNGEDLINEPGHLAMRIPPREGWFAQYRVQFYDFTLSEGVFPPDVASESIPKMRASDIFVFFRDCDGGSQTEVCDNAASGSEFGAVSERGIETDLTRDGDRSDTNNIISGFPRKVSEDPLDKPYSALWRVNRVVIPPGNDDRVHLMDTSHDQNATDINTPQRMREYVAAGLVLAPMPMSETQAGNSIPGNDGEVFFNCPSQVPAE